MEWAKDKDQGKRWAIAGEEGNAVIGKQNNWLAGKLQTATDEEERMP